MNLLEMILAALLAVPAMEWVAVAFALGYLWLAIAQNAWCWPAAIVSSALYLVLFARAGLLMQAALQVFYIAMAIYGWRAWRGSSQAPPLAIRRWSPGQHLAALAAVAIVTSANGAFIAHAAAGPLVAYADAAIAWASVLTTWMVARKILENWLYWIVIDLAAAVLYGTQGLHATAVLFVLYAALAWRGYRTWRLDLRQSVVVEAGAAT